MQLLTTTAVKRQPPTRMQLGSPATIFVSDTLDGWLEPHSALSAGLLVKRPFDGKWDAFAPDIDTAKPRFGVESALTTKVA